MFTSEIREVCVNVSIEVDDVYENDETFTVTVATNDNQASVQPDRTTGTVTIADDDCKLVTNRRIMHASLALEVNS